MATVSAEAGSAPMDVVSREERTKGGSRVRRHWRCGAGQSTSLTALLLKASLPSEEAAAASSSSKNSSSSSANSTLAATACAVAAGAAMPPRP